ncbi:hypothetical protein DZF91_32600 [Actinomadura logoneensis]|uniref:Uncharacterized protein n=1 Tax=Actinomadura logoneensis TaxID=2293572 RepID=A0A372JBW9_9ACTN|nr:hypothetical protein [Actinomadura logoneensis]RFU37501.1 hypothetical protein DZF91_32600 [Actinomadura logoneensis]
MIEARDSGATPGPTPAGSPSGTKTGGRDFWPADSAGDGGKGPKGLNPKLLIGGAVALAVVVAAVVGAVLVSGGDKKSGGAAATAGEKLLPTAFTPWAPEKEMARLADRQHDERPITVGEVFPSDVKTVSYKKYSFTLAGTDLAADCKQATWGAALQADLAKFQCSQVARGAYVSQDKQHVGQFAVLNMVSQEGAQQVVRNLDPATNAGFVRALNPSGATPFHSGFSAAYAHTYGHFVVVSWVQRAGGAQPANLSELVDLSLAVEKPADFVWGRLEMAGNPAKP